MSTEYRNNMCGRYTLTADISFLQARFGMEVVEVPFTPRYNVAPTQEVLTVVRADSTNEGRLMRWGLVPHWAKDMSIGSRMINARAETLAESKVFGQLFPTRRCLVVADSFYEWRKEGSRKAPVRVMLKSGEPFAFAGLWSVWRPREKPDTQAVLSCTIITTVPNSLMEPIHNRMPVMFSSEAEDAWLDPSASTAELRELLLPFSAEEMTAYEVSRLVNSPRNDVPQCIQPA